MASWFQKKLLNWYEENPRELPWKVSKDPYPIYLSEIILQQTRVQQGLPYYEKFIETYPTIQALANAPLNDVLKLWEGLGYYSRARNLHFTAKHIASELGNKFPDNFKDLLKLKGVGEYTAAAIASFAYNEAVAVVDGNVYRVLSRVFGIDEAIDSTQGKKNFKLKANQELNRKRPGDFNQAIMNFGAMHCLPKQPKCEECPFQKECVALKSGRIDILPFKSKKLVRRHRYFNYFVFFDQEHMLIQQREQKDIWNQLFELILIETNDQLLEKIEIKKTTGQYSLLLQQAKSILLSKVFTQLLTHQKIEARFILVEIDGLTNQKIPSTAKLIKRSQLHQFAFPKIINQFLTEAKLIF